MMNIGDAAAASGVSAKMIRYYESIGLVPNVVRTEVGYRVYGASHIYTLRFIRRARPLRASADVKRVALTHIEELERKMREIEGMTRTLRHLAHHCQGDGRPDCPILQ